MDEILDIINQHLSFPPRSKQAKLIAKDWQDENFDAQEAQLWLSSGCFSPVAAAEMREAGLEPELIGLS
jgi:hypothetical protein